MNNSFAAAHPELVCEWSEKNLPLMPDKITYGSNKIVWWKANCGHEWQTSVKSRSAGEKCPICSGARVVEGINDLATLKPELARQWSKKNKLKPTQVSLGSHTETLKLLSKVFDVSINTLLGSPRKLICQCCGMPLEDDDIIGHNHDGSFNEDYCKWCYADGTYTYNDMDDLIEVCVKNMVSENFTEEQARSYMKELLPTLDYWKKYDELSDNGQFEEFKKKLINEINELNVDGMPKVEKLNALVGKYVNLEYRLPNGQAAKFLNEAKTYLGNQLECEYGGDRCFGVVADMDFILICTYEEDGKNPELVLYKKR